MYCGVCFCKEGIIKKRTAKGMKDFVVKFAMNFELGIVQ